jgi:hypothetical protein
MEAAGGDRTYQHGDTHDQGVVVDPSVPRYWRNGALLCNAHNSAGELCEGIAIKGKTKCRKHGGRSLSGRASPTYKHGRYSKDLLTGLAARVDEARGNPELLSVSDDIALIEGRIAEVLQQLGTGESGAAWQDLQKTLAEFQVALARGDTAGMNTHFAAMQHLVRAGSGTARAWEELRRLEETRCKLVHTEMKTLQGLQQLMTIQQHLLLVSAQTEAVVQAVQAHTDTATGRKILMAVQAEFTRLATLEAH